MGVIGSSATRKSTAAKPTASAAKTLFRANLFQICETSRKNLCANEGLFNARKPTAITANASSMPSKIGEGRVKGKIAKREN